FALNFLPAPTQLSQEQLEAEERRGVQRSQSTALVSTGREPLPYGFRKSWVPRVLEDFGDGGAFPEIHVAQYPLEMGRKKRISNALAVQVDAEGNIKYDAIARQGASSSLNTQDMLPKEVLNEDDPELQKPDEEAVNEVRSPKDKKYIKIVVFTRAGTAIRGSILRFSERIQGLAFNSGAKQRVIRMVEIINKKIPRGPPSPPSPVMHSPSRKMTVKEQQEWKIPPCISNWKNAKGYTIPLDKRLAADGRGLQTVHINENFAKLAEALYIADRKAREAVKMRAQVEKKMAQKEKEKKEEKLRELAKMARDRRAGIKAHGDKGGEDTEVRERDEIRHERRKERQHMHFLHFYQDRDVLGQPNPRTSSEAQRLFNQNKGMDSGFAGGEDEIYNVYDQPFRSGRDMAQNIYRPSKNADVYGDDLDTHAEQFVPDREFSGADHGPRRDGPVQFEEDAFGLNKFLEEAKQHGGSKRVSTSGRSKDYDHEKKCRKE
uniref:SNW domain-containing protein 1 n=1 Tax=Sinocyclocheilus grahami TaxID=75366 RepID=A0A672T2I3_SINGR